MPPDAQLRPGTLDVLILKSLSLGRNHGYGVLLRIEQITGGALVIEQGRCTRPWRGSSARGCSDRLGRLRQQPARQVPTR